MTTRQRETVVAAELKFPTTTVTFTFRKGTYDKKVPLFLGSRDPERTSHKGTDFLRAGQPRVESNVCVYIYRESRSRGSSYRQSRREATKEESQTLRRRKSILKIRSQGYLSFYHVPCRSPQTDRQTCTHPVCSLVRPTSRT